MKVPAGPQNIVFIVDDDASVRESLGSLLRSVGLHVELFDSAAQFLKAPLPEAASCLVLDRPASGCERPRFPGGTGQEQYSCSHHFHHRTWRYTDAGAGHES